MRDEEVVADGVQFVGAHARPDGGADRLDRPGRDPAAGPDPLDLGGRVAVAIPVRTGSGRPTYSGRAMPAGTDREGEIRPGTR